MRAASSLEKSGRDALRAAAHRFWTFIGAEEYQYEGLFVSSSHRVVAFIYMYIVKLIFYRRRCRRRFSGPLRDESAGWMAVASVKPGVVLAGERSTLLSFLV